MRTTGETVAALTSVTKRYGAVVAVDALDLTVRRGELLAVLGPNGAGKTTSLSMLLGLIAPTQGKAEVFGRSPEDSEARMRVGAMLQVSHIPDTMKVREHLHLFSSYYPNPLPVARVITAAGLQGLEGRLSSTLSGGQKQRLMFALALVGNPDLVFLDEPTVGLDVEARRALWTVIRGLVDEGRTVVLTTHYLEEADALADRIVVIAKGKVIAEGRPDEIKAHASGRRIRCVTRLSKEHLLALPGVTSVRKDGAASEILTPDAEGVIRELLLRDSSLSGLEVAGAGLEEAFLSLTEQKEAA